MNISIKAQGFDVTAAIDAFVREEVRLTLARYADDIVSVDIFLKDTNGPKGGVDKQVLMHIHLRGLRPLALLTTREDLYGAIKLASKKAKRVVRRNLRKSRRFEKLSLRRLVTDSLREEALKT